jgi:hypothetical protein
VCAPLPPAALKAGHDAGQLTVGSGVGRRPHRGVDEPCPSVAERVIAELGELGVVSDARDERGLGVV